MTTRRSTITRALAGVAALTLGLGAISAQAGPSHDKAARIGQQAPDFTLTDSTGTTHTLSDYVNDGKIVVLEWFSPACPYVKLHHEQQTTMTDLASKYQDKGVVWLAINSTREGHPGAGKDESFRAKWNISYPVLDDHEGTVGHLYGARTTPHMFIINKDGILAYDGAIDNDRRNAKSPAEKVNYVAQALDEILAGETVTQASTKPYGCGVKYAN